MSDYFEEAPLAEKTLSRHNWFYKGRKYVNDMGFPCLYRVLENGVELGIIQYYGGRKLSCMEKIKEQTK